MRAFRSLFIVVVILFLQELALPDFHQTVQVGPGIFHHHIFRENGPWHIHVLEFPLNDSLIKVETVKANDLLYGNERTSQMASRNDEEGHRVVGAINGDFYSTGGVPVGAQVLKGTLLKRPTTRSVFAVSDQQRPIIGIVSFSGSLIANDSVVHTIDGINESRDTDDMIIYNHFFGTSTGTNFWGTEIIAEYLNEPFYVNDEIFLQVIGKDSITSSGHGNNQIPQNGLVISGHGSSAIFLNENLFVGDTISIELNLTPPDLSISELIGGTPRLIRDGVVSVEWEAEGTGQSFAYDRHPRTAIGISADSTRCFLFTVDGRQQGYSMGMSLFELASFMTEWGVYQGVNLDGGGSTTMWVRGSVVNSPSDAGGERSVANALMVVSIAPTGVPAHLTIIPDEVYVLANNQTSFSFSVTDSNFNPVNLPPDSVFWSCDTSLGSISPDGIFTSGTDTISGYVYLSYRNLVDSALVHITDVASIDLQPSPVILNQGQQELIEATAYDNYSNIIELEPRDFKWSVSDSLGTINAIGLFTAQEAGSGYIFARYHDISGSTRVYIDTLDFNIVEDFSDLNEWSLSGYRINLSECSLETCDSIYTTPPSSGELKYSLTTGGVSTLYMDCDIPIPGIPFSVSIDLYGDGKGHWLRGEFQDADDEKFIVDFTPEDPGINWSGSWNFLQVELSTAIPHWGNPSAGIDFPIRWTKIYLAETDENHKDSGTIYLDNFIVSYLPSSVVQNPEKSLPHSFLLKSVAPNPFNPVTYFTLEIKRPGDLQFLFFDLLGREVDDMNYYNLSQGKTIVIPWNASHLASGIYLFNIVMKDYTRSGKCVLLK